MRRRIPARWHCYGCDKEHPNTRDIEGESGPARYWCRHSMVQAIKTRRNDTPPAFQLRSIWRASPALQKGFPQP